MGFQIEESKDGFHVNTKADDGMVRILQELISENITKNFGESVTELAFSDKVIKSLSLRPNP